MPKNKNSNIKKSKKTKYVSLNMNELKSDELKNTINRNDQENTNKNQLEDKIKCKELLKEGRKYDNANDETDSKYHDINSDENKISSDQQNKITTLGEQIEHSLNETAQKNFKRDNRNSKKNGNENNTKGLEFAENDKLMNRSNKDINKYQFGDDDKCKELLKHEINGKAKEESDKIEKSNKKINTVARRHKDKLNGDNITKNHNKPNIVSSTEKQNSESTQDYCNAQNKQKSDTIGSNSESTNIYHNLKKTKTRNKTTNEDNGNAECFYEEIDEDLFHLPEEFSLAHCVAEDLKMGAGIAVMFKRIFGGVGKLFDQKLKVGDVGIITRKNQNVFYLITKKISSGKPTMKSLESALIMLLRKMKELNLTKLGIPQIGCGLDNLDWADVSSLIKQIFSGSNIHITVCIPSKIEIKKTFSLKIYLTPNNLWEMMNFTVIIIFIDLGSIYKNNWTDNVVEQVNKRYPFKENLLKDIKTKKLKPGDITQYCVKNEFIFCAFTHQNTYYSSIEDAFSKILKNNKKYLYLAIQSDSINFQESHDNFIHIQKVVLICRSIVYNAELWLCGQLGQTEEQVSYDQYCYDIRNYLYNDSSLKI